MTEAVGGNNINVGSSPVDQNKVNKHTGNQTAVSNISVFSGYDTNKDKTVNYKEANSFNLFGQAKVEQNDSVLNSFGDASFQSRVKSIAVNSFASKMPKMFKNALQQNFSAVANLFAQVTNSDKNEKDSRISTEQSKLDKIVTDEAAKTTKSANEIIQKAYQEALIEAVKLANTDNSAGSGEEALTADDISKKLTGKNKNEKDGKTNIELTKTAYSTYDTSMDGVVNSTEANINNININNYLNSQVTGDLRGAIEADLKAVYDIKTQAFSINSGSKEVTGKNEKEINKNVEKFAKKADKAVEKQTKTFLKQLDSDLKAQVNNTISSMGTDGGLDGRERPISANDGENTVSILNGQCLYNGKPATFKSDKKGGGTVTAEATKGNDTYEVTFNISADGKITNRDETLKSLAKELQNEGAVTDSDVTKDDVVQLSAKHVSKSPKAEGYTNEGNTPEEKLINGLMDRLFDFSTDTNNVEKVSEDDNKNKTFDKNRFNRYKKAGVSNILARYMADSANGITPAGYNNGKITKVKVQQNGISKIIDIKDLQQFMDQLTAKK